jgi:thymidylate synthase (FAD)
MKVVMPSIQITFFIPDDELYIEKKIEKIARVCYKSEDRITHTSHIKFIEKLLNNGHNAMLEFGYATAHLITDRGISHELVRHRLASFAQESTRYCNYSKDKFGNELTFIAPSGLGSSVSAKMDWETACLQAEISYFKLIEQGINPQIARSVLPNCLKTEIIIGANLREWRHIFEQRCAASAHPDMRYLMLSALRKFVEKMPTLFRDLAAKHLGGY